MAYAFVGPVERLNTAWSGLESSMRLWRGAGRPATASSAASRGRRSMDTVAAVPQITVEATTGTRNAMSPSRGREHVLWSTTRALGNKAMALLSAISSKHPVLAHVSQRLGTTIAPAALTEVLEATTIQELAEAASVIAPQAALETLEQLDRAAAHGAKHAQQAARKHAQHGPINHAALLAEFLAAADHLEISYASLLADLSNLAYDISQLRDAELRERHNLVLISTSGACMMGPKSRESWSKEVQEQRDSRSTSPARSSSTTAPATAAASRRSSTDGSCTTATLTAASAALTDGLTSHRLSSHGSCSGSGSPLLTPSVSLVNLAALSGDTSSSEDPATYPVLTFVPAADSEWAHQDQQHSPPHSPRGAIELVLPPGSPKSPAHSHHSRREQGPGRAHKYKHSTSSKRPTSPKVTVPVVPQGSTSSTTADTVSPQAGAVTAIPEPPSAWFVADDPITKIRYFVVQGSTNLEHWQINMQFDPVIFEDPALGVRIHRGVYQAALRLYDDLLPLVRQHINTSPFATVAFTGHSLGGSLATALMLLFLQRGVIQPDAVSPVYTFGAPAVFCGGADHDAPADRCDSCSLKCEVHGAPPGAFPLSCQKPVGLLQQCGLTDDHVVNVIMHRDIVPRAFACDYTLVADLLKQWMPSFKDHSTLQGPAHAHKSLYNFIGRMSIIRPDPSSPFVHASDAHHPHLPATPGLYRLVAPAPTMTVHSLSGSYELLDHAKAAEAAAATGHRHITTQASRHSRSSSHARSSRSSSSSAPAAAAPQQPPTDVRGAISAFMNFPHPLTTLTEYGAYGPNGTISRYHNPDNYTKGLLALIGQAPHQLTGPKPAAPAAPQQHASAAGHRAPHVHAARHVHGHGHMAQGSSHRRGINISNGHHSHSHGLRHVQHKQHVRHPEGYTAHMPTSHAMQGSG